MDILEDIFFNEIELNGVKCDQELTRKSYALEEKLLGQLDEENQKQFLEYVNMQSGLDADLHVNAFCKGARFGARLMIDLLNGE